MHMTAILDKPATLDYLEIQFPMDMTDEDFFRFCQVNENVRIERDSTGNIHIMPPTGFDTGNFKAEITGDLINWNRKHRLGLVGESSTGYNLPNGATRAPDASWVSNERLSGISAGQRKKFLPVCPDFVLELHPPSDSLSKVKEKMTEYMENGCRLGWLIDPQNEQVFVYRMDGSISVIKSFSEPLLGEDVLPGFELNLSAF
jgi:Uma2 family endonuclease